MHLVKVNRDSSPERGTRKHCIAFCTLSIPFPLLDRNRGNSPLFCNDHKDAYCALHQRMCQVWMPARWSGNCSTSQAVPIEPQINSFALVWDNIENLRNFLNRNRQKMYWHYWENEIHIDISFHVAHIFFWLFIMRKLEDLWLSSLFLSKFFTSSYLKVICYSRILYFIIRIFN